MFCDLAASRELAWRLLVRDINTRYRQSVLGVAWAFLPPVVTAFAFVFLSQQGILVVGDTGVSYPVFVMVGTVLWQLFADSVGAPLNVVKNSQAMLTKINFSREALILSAVGAVLFNHAIRLIILTAFFAIYQVPLTWGIPLALLGMLCIILMGVTLGMFLIPFGILYTDVSAALSIVLGLWFYLTPVVYMPPQRWPFTLVISANPVSPLLVGTRDLLVAGTLSAPSPFLVTFGLTGVGFVAAWVLYRLSLSVLIERLG